MEEHHSQRTNLSVGPKTIFNRNMNRCIFLATRSVSREFVVEKRKYHMLVHESKAFESYIVQADFKGFLMYKQSKCGTQKWQMFAFIFRHFYFY